MVMGWLPAEVQQQISAEATLLPQASYSRQLEAVLLLEREISCFSPVLRFFLMSSLFLFQA